MIEVQQITKRYGQHTALDRVSFSVAKGEVLAFLGPNGAGKTTTMRILTCFMPATEGTARVAGFDCADQPLEVRLAEIVREQALAVTRQEVPHSIAVVVDELEVEDGLTKIHASLIVERDSQKGIVIGKGGETLKTIGSRARQEMELVLGGKVFLDLHVKVLKEWQRDPKALQRLGF